MCLVDAVECMMSFSALCVLQYRTTVAKMLAKQANDPRNPAQFIITTFHPQIIHETDKVYGVSHQNRISRYGPCRLLPPHFMTICALSCIMTQGFFVL